MTDAPRAFKALKRFNYWDHPALNPLLDYHLSPFDSPKSAPEDVESITHRHLSAKFQKAFEAGDREAIFQYARASMGVFDEPWVRHQIKYWRQENTPEARKNLHRLMRAYTDERGKESLADIVYVILRDQEIYQELVTRNQQGIPLTECFAILGEKYRLKENSVKEIYEVYGRKFHEFHTGAKKLSLKIRKSLEAGFAAKGWTLPDWEKSPRRRVHPAPPPWMKFYQWHVNRIPPHATQRRRNSGSVKGSVPFWPGKQLQSPKRQLMRQYQASHLCARVYSSSL
jgi:hypothetical protein